MLESGGKVSFMSDWDRVLLRGVTALQESTPEARRDVYRRALDILLEHLRKADPPLAESNIAAQQRLFEEAVARIEAEVSTKPLPPAPTPASKDRVSQDSWLTDILARASKDEVAELAGVEKPQFVKRQVSVVPFLRRPTNKTVEPDRVWQTNRLDEVHKILRKLHTGSSGVKASALISKDGMMIASCLTADMEETRVAGMAATLQNLGSRFALELARGKVQEIIVRGNGYAIMINAGHDSLLLALADETSKGSSRNLF
jgi:predicted regulator of Ras-like GTPase activity (Roadblock/LC7/MglB family)